MSINFLGFLFGFVLTGGAAAGEQIYQEISISSSFLIKVEAGVGWLQELGEAMLTFFFSGERAGW